MSDLYRIAVDVGGTFTDIVVLNETTGALMIDKASTTPENTIDGVISAIKKIGVDKLRAAKYFIHGSTTALNALLESKVVPTAYLTTRGFRDVPEIGRGNRPEMYNAKYHKSPLLVPRHLRFEVDERLDARGRIITKLDEPGAIEVIHMIQQTDAEAIAVCLLHAPRNPLHEQRLRELIQERAPKLAVALSSSVAPEHREFERGITTILNACLSAIVERWVDDLQKALRDLGFSGEVVLTRSDGAGLTPEAVKRSPINMLLSGPAGGVIGGVCFSGSVGIKDLITADVGGTSFDVALIQDGNAATQQQASVNGYPVLISTLDIRTIGAGGGSLAAVDSAGALHIGPQSAAAVPGPICYRRGGVKPTVTDAFVVNGYIDPDRFLGGEMNLDVAGAKKGISTYVADPLKLSLHDGSSGILRLATANMSEAVKGIASEVGADPREYALLCFGGGGPLFGAFILDELELSASIVPIAPSVYSAWGMLSIDLRHDLVRPHTSLLTDLQSDQFAKDFEELVRRGHALLDAEHVPAERRSLELLADLRYAGQEHSLSVSVTKGVSSEADLVSSLKPAFDQAYERRFGYRLANPVETVNLRVKATGHIPAPEFGKLPARTDGQVTRRSSRQVYDFLANRWDEASVFDRMDLRSGDKVLGPILIEEPTTTTIVRSGQVMAVDGYGNMIITRAA
jgi:N-methylhydantoinase A